MDLEIHQYASLNSVSEKSDDMYFIILITTYGEHWCRGIYIPPTF